MHLTLGNANITDSQDLAVEINLGEVLSDFDWKVSGDSAALEARLYSELMALEAVISQLIYIINLCPSFLLFHIQVITKPLNTLTLFYNFFFFFSLSRQMFMHLFNQKNNRKF